MMETANDQHAISTDVKTLRERARQHLDKASSHRPIGEMSGKRSRSYRNVLATEIVCVLRYTMQSIAATGISSEGVKEELPSTRKKTGAHGGGC